MFSFRGVERTVDIKNARLVLIGGRPGMGKSRFGMNLVIWLEQPSVIFNLETSKDIILKKFKDANVKNDIDIFDTPHITVDYIEEKCRKLKQEKDIKIVLIDYLQLMDYEDDSVLGARLKKIAEELDLTIIVLSQLSQSVEERKDKIPVIEDYEKNEGIVNEADVVMSLYRESYYNPETERKNKFDMILHKNPNGKLLIIKMMIEMYQI